MNAYIFLGLAIVLELFSTSMLKASVGFTKIIPSISFVIGMGFSFYFISLALNVIPLNIAYATWAGLGTALTALIGIYVWKEAVNLYGVIGIVLVVAGVIVLNFE